MPVTVSSRQGDILFHGLIRGIGLSNESDYSEVTVNAVGLSVRTDERKKNRTFQSTGKTLQEITDTVMGEYGISVEVTKDVPIEIMLSQKNETDWEFLRRVANKFGALVFTDCHSKQLRITLGTQGFSEKPEEKSVNKTIEKNISAFLKLKGNINPDASAYEFESVSAESHSLNMGSGHISGGKACYLEQDKRIGGTDSKSEECHTKGRCCTGFCTDRRTCHDIRSRYRNSTCRRGQ